MTAAGVDFVGSGTGANYPVVLGAMSEFLRRGMRPASLTATSGSAIVFSLLAAGYSPDQILGMSRDMGPDQIIKKNWRIFTPGVFHLDALVTYLRGLLPSSFAGCKIPLAVVTTNSDTCEPVYFSTRRTPCADVALAVQASTSVPWLFRHVVIGGMRLVDGGVVDNFPLDWPGGDNVVGIRVLGPRVGKDSRWCSWPGFSLNMARSVMTALEREHVEDGVWAGARVLTIESPISSMDFMALDQDMTSRLVETGVTAVEKWLET